MKIVAEKGKVVFWGIDNINRKLDEILDSLNLEKNFFEIKVIMSEAITNAFIHGNGKDKSKPIIMKWDKNKEFINITVEDSGEKNKKVDLNQFIDNEDILSESGRGLYIISAYTDSVRFTNNKIIMKKSLL